MGNIFTKIKWIAALGLVFIIVFMTNQVDKKSFDSIKNSIENIYQDRLLVKGYIYDISSLLEQKKIAVYTNDTIFFEAENEHINEAIEAHLGKFYKTKLVNDENRLLNNFDEDFQKLKTQEMDFDFSESQSAEMLAQLQLLSDDLYDLSRIQLEEGKKQLQIAQKSVNVADLFSQIEIIILVLIAVIVQFIILYNPKGK